MATSAFTILRNFFESLGIQYSAEINAVIKDAMQQGYGPDQIDLIMPELEDTKAFKQRFPGFHRRTSNGYNQLELGEYLQLENSYHRILQEAGLPAGFYDDPSDFGNWIANDVSPDEIQSRVQVAVTVAKQVDPTTRNLMAKFYGLTTGDIASYFLDQRRALPVIERQFQTAQIATAAAQNGFGVKNIKRYENLLDRGVTADQAQQGYGTVRSLTDTVGKIAGVYGEDFTQADAEADVFFNNSDKRRRIVSQEQATFNGSSRGSTGTSQRQSY